MSPCPDWRRLDPAARDAPGALHAARWQEALRHLDGGCPRCWQEAVAVDPTLIFRRLPAPQLAAAQEAEEVEAARLAVAAMRTASRLEGRDAGTGRDGLAALARPSLTARRRFLPALRLRSLPPLHAARWALAAGLTAMALIFGSGHGWHASAPASAAAQATLAAGRLPDAAAAADAAAAPGPATDATPGGRPSAVGASLTWTAAPVVLPASSRPSIEGLSRPEARVYQIDSPHMSVVMIVDDKLDV